MPKVQDAFTLRVVSLADNLPSIAASVCYLFVIAAASVGDKLLTVQCSLASNAPFTTLSGPGAFASVAVKVNRVTGLGVCESEYFDHAEIYNAAVSITTQARLTIDSPGIKNVCYGVTSVSAVFKYAVKAQTSLTFTTASGCNKIEGKSCAGGVDRPC